MVVLCAHNCDAEEAKEGQILGAHWPINLAQTMRSRLSERLCQNKQTSQGRQ